MAKEKKNRSPKEIEADYQKKELAAKKLREKTRKDKLARKKKRAQKERKIYNKRVNYPIKFVFQISMLIALLAILFSFPEEIANLNQLTNLTLKTFLVFISFVIIGGIIISAFYMVFGEIREQARITEENRIKVEQDEMMRLEKEREKEEASSYPQFPSATTNIGGLQATNLDAGGLGMDLDLEGGLALDSGDSFDSGLDMDFNDALINEEENSFGQ